MSGTMMTRIAAVSAAGALLYAMSANAEDAEDYVLEAGQYGTITCSGDTSSDKGAGAARKYATGGEVASFRYHDKAGIGYTAFLHKFTNTAEVAKFKNRFGKALPVRVLAVGGGGAGMDGFFYDYSNLLPGGGGGGGGGVSEIKKSLSVGEEWSIRVGAGGEIANHNYGAQRGVAGGTSISNALSEVVFVPGGGAGGGGRYEKETYSQPTVGAAGGGGSCDDSNQTDIINGAPGMYSSHTLNDAGGLEIPVGAPFKGGDGLAWSSKGYGGVSEEVEVEYALAQIPYEAGDKVLTKVDGVTYHWMSMNYILAAQTNSNIYGDIEATFHYNGCDLDVTIPSVPYRRNYRTNILGTLFTGPAKFNVEVVPGFAGDISHDIN